MTFFRKKGISLLIPTQNVEQTVELCIKSFAEFPDEMIIVDNGSNDNTKEIVKSFEKEFDHLTFYDVPELKDLYENRQYAFARSKYNWIVRIDSDYVAYTSGKYDIKNLRYKILNTKFSLKPIAFGITQVNLFHDYYHTGPKQVERDPAKTYHIDWPTNTLSARIIHWYPGMRFQRLGKWEGVRWQNRLKHIQLQDPYWFHCSFKTKKDHLIRFYRNHWRELGDFKKYPSRDDYIKEIIFNVYGTEDFNTAAELHWMNNVEPYMIEYDEDKIYPYPDLIKDKL